MEHEQRAQATPIVPEFAPPNIDYQPGWLLMLIQHFIRLLRQFRYSGKHLGTEQVKSYAAPCNRIITDIERG